MKKIVILFLIVLGAVMIAVAPKGGNVSKKRSIKGRLK
jgi:hypothetical protein